MEVKVLEGDTILKMEKLLQRYLGDIGVDFAFLINEAGNVLAFTGDATRVDVTSLAALAAANFGATHHIAKILGEDDFAVLYHKGEKENIYLNKIREDLILVSVFNDEVPLGLVRLKVQQLTKELEKVSWP